MCPTDEASEDTGWLIHRQGLGVIQADGALLYWIERLLSEQEISSMS